VAVVLGVAAVIGATALIVDRYLLGGREGGGVMILRLIARLLVFGGVGGLALTLLSLPGYAVLPATIAFAATGAWLGSTLDSLDPDGWDQGTSDAIEGGPALVIETVTRDSGQVMVDDGAERWYLAARPFRDGHYEADSTVVVVSIRDGVALVARREEVGR